MNRRTVLGAVVGAGSFVTGSVGSRLTRTHLGWGLDASSSRLEGRAWASIASGRVIDAKSDSVTVRLERTARERDAGRIAVARREYPDGRILADAVSERVRIARSDRPTDVTVDVPARNPDARRPWYYDVSVVQDDGTNDRATRFLCESRPYRRSEGSGTVVEPAARIAEPRASPEGARFERSLDGNAFALTYRWPDYSRSDRECVELTVPMRRSAYDAGRTRERGHVVTYEESIRHPTARRLANALCTDVLRGSPRTGGRADDRTGIDGASLRTDSRERLGPARTLPRPAPSSGGSDSPDDGAKRLPSEYHQFRTMVRFVQNLPYGYDPDVLGAVDYNRTIEETLIDGRGDCKDKTNLLAGLLARSSLGCDTAMIYQPTHIFLGVSPADVPARIRRTVDRVTLNGREYVPVETTHPTRIGAYPDEPITAVYDDGWAYYDPSKFGRVATDFARTVETTVRNRA